MPREAVTENLGGTPVTVLVHRGDFSVPSRCQYGDRGQPCLCAGRFPVELSSVAMSYSLRFS